MEVANQDDPHAGHSHGRHPMTPHADRQGENSYWHDPSQDNTIFWFLIVGIIALQAALGVWKARSPKSYHIITLAGVAILPQLRSLPTPIASARPQE